MSTPANPFAAQPPPVDDKLGRLYLPGNAHQFHPQPHGKLPPVAPVHDFKGAQAAIEARRAQMADAATAARVAAGNATLAETIAHLEAQKGTTTATSRTEPERE